MDLAHAAFPLKKGASAWRVERQITPPAGETFGSLLVLMGDQQAVHSPAADGGGGVVDGDPID